MALGYSVHVGRDPPPALQPGTAGSAGSQAAPPSWLALAVPRARLYGPLSASLLCLHLSCRILSSVCQGVCPTPSLWAFVWPPLLFPVHLLLAPASAAPQRPVRENSTFFFSPTCYPLLLQKGCQSHSGLGVWGLFGSGFACACERACKFPCSSSGRDRGGKRKLAAQTQRGPGCVPSRPVRAEAARTPRGAALTWQIGVG